MADIHRIESRVMTDNEKSVHIMERLGFIYEGMEYGSILIGGSFRDHLRYAWINPEYKKNQAGREAKCLHFVALLLSFRGYT